MVFAGLEGTYAVALTAPGYLQRLGDATDVRAALLLFDVAVGKTGWCRPARPGPFRYGYELHRL